MFTTVNSYQHTGHTHVLLGLINIYTHRVNYMHLKSEWPSSLLTFLKRKGGKPKKKKKRQSTWLSYLTAYYVSSALRKSQVEIGCMHVYVEWTWQLIHIAMEGGIIIDKSQCVAGQLRDALDLLPDDGLQAAVHHAPSEPVRAGVLIREGGADPGLHIADHELELLGARGCVHLGDGPPKLINCVAQLLHAVRHCADLPGLESVGSGELHHHGGSCLGLR